MIKASIVAKGIWIAVIVLVFLAMVRWPDYQNFIGNGFVIVVLLGMGMVAIVNPLFFAKYAGAAAWMNKLIFPCPRRTRLIGLAMIIGAVFLFCLTTKV